MLKMARNALFFEIGSIQENGTA